MKIKNIIFVFISLLTLQVFAQSNSDIEQQKMMQNQIEELMKRREEMFRSLLNDDSFKDMEKRMQEMMKNFGDDDIDFSANSYFGGGVVGEYDWKETDKYKMLSLKVKQIKDKPLDIKIEKGQINIKGDVEEVKQNKAHNNSKSITKIHFERSFSIPNGVDEKNPEFENKDGELLIKFKKKLAQANPKIKKNPTNNPINNEERTPVMPDKGDISL